MRFIGIDPGTTGAIAVLDGDTREAAFFDTPTMQVKVGKVFKNVQDGPALCELMRSLTSGCDVYVVIEKVNAMPGRGENGEKRSMGATSAFSFGVGFGMWLGVLAALLVPHAQVHPITWKKMMMADMTKEKDASRIKALQLYPKTAPLLSRKKDHNRADALLMADWGRRTYK